MSHSKSILPIDHWTTGLDAAQLRGLAERHRVVYEVAADHTVKSHALVRSGWFIDLYGRKSEADAALRFTEHTEHIHDVLHALARSIVPAEHDHVAVHLSQHDGAVRLDTKDGFAEEVRLRVHVRPMSDARPTLIDDAGSSELDEIARSLAALGIHRRG
jgi:hypothetical protein